MRGVVVGYYATQKEAYDALARLVDTEVTEKYNWTFAQVYEAWSKEHYPGLSKKIVNNYISSYKHSEPLHNSKFRSLRPMDFQAVLDAESHKSEGTVKARKSLFIQMAAWAVKNDIVAKNYAEGLADRGRKPKPHQPFTPKEIARIQADPTEDARIVCMLLATGMRISELFQLPLSDYYGDYVIGGEKTEAGRERIIPIRPEGRDHFAYFAERAAQKGKPRIIDGYDGPHYADAYRKTRYHPLLERLGIDPSKTPHSSRVSYGTRAATEDQLAPAVLQKVMGHSKFEITQKFYNKPGAEALVKAVDEAAKRDDSK